MSRISLDDCTFCVYTEQRRQESNPFDCNNADLNEFFEKDAKDFAGQLLGKSYCFYLDSDPKEIVCIFTISNDSVKVRQLPKASQKILNKDIPSPKQRLKSFPAVLIGRIGVDKKYQGNDIGTQVLDTIKAWFREDGNKTGCRFVVVDAYNITKILGFYSSNKFNMLFEDENEEAEHLGIRRKAGDNLHTRIMVYDLIQIMPSQPMIAQADQQGS